MLTQELDNEEFRRAATGHRGIMNAEALFKEARDLLQPVLLTVHCPSHTSPVLLTVHCPSHTSPVLLTVHCASHTSPSLCF